MINEVVTYKLTQEEIQSRYGNIKPRGLLLYIGNKKLMRRRFIEKKRLRQNR